MEAMYDVLSVYASIFARLDSIAAALRTEGTFDRKAFIFGWRILVVGRHCQSGKCVPCLKLRFEAKLFGRWLLYQYDRVLLVANGVASSDRSQSIFVKVFDRGINDVAEREFRALASRIHARLTYTEAPTSAGA